MRGGSGGRSRSATASSPRIPRRSRHRRSQSRRTARRSPSLLPARRSRRSTSRIFGSERTFGNHVTVLAWSPDGRLIATGGDNGRVELRDARTGRLVRELGGFHGNPKGAEAVQAIVFDRTGKLVAAVDGDFFAGPQAPYGHLAVWDATTGRLEVRPERHAAFGYSIAFAPDDRTVAAGFSGGDAYVVGLPSGHSVRTIKPTGGDVVSVAIARSGTIATGTWAGIVQLWNPATGAQVGHPVLAQPSPIASLDFDASGDTFSTTGGSDGTAKLWDAATLQQVVRRSRATRASGEPHGSRRTARTSSWCTATAPGMCGRPRSPRGSPTRAPSPGATSRARSGSATCRTGRMDVFVSDDSARRRRL